MPEPFLVGTDAPFDDGETIVKASSNEVVILYRTIVNHYTI